MRTLAPVALLFALAPAFSQDQPDGGLATLAGEWKVAATTGHGRTVVAANSNDEFGQPLWAQTRFTFKGDTLRTVQEPVVLFPGMPDVGLLFAINTDERDYRLRLPKPTGNGRAPIDLIVRKAVVLKGIYELKDDTLKLCVVNWLACTHTDEQRMIEEADSKPRPIEFASKDGNTVSYVLKRVKK